MKSQSPTSISLLTILAFAISVTGCVTAPSKSTLQSVRTQSNPTDRAQRNVTNFTPALRCMDDLMFRNGIRDVTLMMEELRDSSQKIPVSARDMMTSAVSEMTRRSRAIRLSTFGGDQANLTQLLQVAQKNSAFAVIPEFNVRGSISQLDEDIQKQGSTLGALAERAFGIRLSSETKFTSIAFDTAVSATETFTLIPGVASKNTTIIIRRDSAAGDGQARILNNGVVFSFNAARAEGPAQAVRNMVELAAIELVGKLVKLPYWQCLGTSDQDLEVQREIEDWFISMQGPELVVFMKERLRERRYFDGALDDQITPGFLAALSDYRKTNGLTQNSTTLDLAFFKHFVVASVKRGTLDASPRKVNGAAGPSARQASAGQASSIPTSSDGSLTKATVAPTTSSPQSAVSPATINFTAIDSDVATSGGVTSTAIISTGTTPGPAIEVTNTSLPGTAPSLVLSATQAGYVYCYAQDLQSQKIRRIFPNRFVRDSRVEQGSRVLVPGSARFRLPIGHQYACMYAPKEVYGDLPAPLRWGDFEDIKMTSFEGIRLAFQAVAGAPVSLSLVRAAGMR